MKLVISVFLFVATTVAAESTMHLARQNYMLNCQGCHLPDGSGSAGVVPKMNDFVGNFLHVPGGREFLVQVPGSANAPISDQELADVMNWVLENFSKKELPTDFSPYTAAEIAELRKTPMIDGSKIRVDLIQDIEDKLGIKEES